MTLTFNLGPDPGQAAQRCTTPSAAVTLPRPGSYSITRPTLTCAPRAGGRRRSCPWALRSRSPPCWQLARWHATLLTTSPNLNPDLLRSYGCLGFVGVSWGSAKLTRTLALSVCAQPFCSPCPTLTTCPCQVRLLRSRGADPALCNREGQDMPTLALAVRPADTTLLEELKARKLP